MSPHLPHPTPLNSFHSSYRLARAMGYDTVIFSNNDVLVPTGSISRLAEVLTFKEFPVVVPLTTRHACGHNPIQVSGIAVSCWAHSIQCDSIV